MGWGEKGKSAPTPGPQEGEPIKKRTTKNQKPQNKKPEQHRQKQNSRVPTRS